MWLLLTISADGERTGTVYTENGTASVNLPCGEVAEDASTTVLYINKNDRWDKILEFGFMQARESPKYADGYSAVKYGINKSVNTALLVKNIELSDIKTFGCRTKVRTKEATSNYIDSHIIKLQVLSKSHLTICLVCDIPERSLMLLFFPLSTWAGIHKRS